ncbi:tyrosine-protein kinase family protein [Litoreibacter halocynthiae]|uniref:tyrosine-protein kinase family protein n=1 Tax=Litoreibacter halocynthiae TaxID=1242689 RepID=UPI0024903F62|nr:CpsD/CapB family tyrosine-protein kinase [Litoreibacter halocynthiae]
MEKLQKALEKARGQRGGTKAPDLRSHSKQSHLRGKTAKAAVKAPLSLWDDLTPYEPNPDLLLRNRILTLNSEAEANPFDVLRTKVFLLMQENGWTRLAITSPNKDCGKTTTACNLAIGFSRQRENRTMLFDFDLRSPAVADMLGRKPNHGIKAMLTGDVPPKDQMLCLRGNVALSLGNMAISDPTQLLLSKHTADMLDKVQADFAPDLMIFDLPSMFAADDARAFLKNADCALILARAEHTTMAQLDTCERQVAEYTNVLGIVLNSCRHADVEGSYFGSK